MESKEIYARAFDLVGKGKCGLTHEVVNGRDFAVITGVVVASKDGMTVTTAGDSPVFHNIRLVIGADIATETVAGITVDVSRPEFIGIGAPEGSPVATSMDELEPGDLVKVIAARVVAATGETTTFLNSRNVYRLVRLETAEG